jgi:two-component system OmpR family sensor kinase
MDHVASLVAQALDAEKVDVFLHDATTATLYAFGTSETLLCQKRAASRLDRQPIANGGRVVQVFLSGEAYINGDVQNDQNELVGIRRALGVRSHVAVPLEVGEVRRGVLAAQSTQPDFFAERDVRFLRAVSRWVGNMVQSIELVERTPVASVEERRRMAAEELVTVLAHDLRNYLGAIRGRVEMVLRRATHDGNHSTVHDTVELRKSVDRLGRLVSDLLDIARIDQGLFELTAEATDLVPLVREAAAVLEVPGTAIEVEVPSALLVVADPLRVRQAVDNLLANAVQHAPAGTAVRIEVARAQSDGASPSTLIRVSDRGPGIDPQLLPRLFDRFTRSSDSNGLGIGLFLARQIAQAHGGQLEVTSSSAIGTQFTLVLPTESARPNGHHAE